jgi:hypothetical protein
MSCNSPSLTRTLASLSESARLLTASASGSLSEPIFCCRFCTSSAVKFSPSKVMPQPSAVFSLWSLIVLALSTVPQIAGTSVSLGFMSGRSPSVSTSRPFRPRLAACMSARAVLAEEIDLISFLNSSSVFSSMPPPFKSSRTATLRPHGDSLIMSEAPPADANSAENTGTSSSARCSAAPSFVWPPRRGRGASRPLRFRAWSLGGRY